jgi:hypothetical protein
VKFITNESSPTIQINEINKICNKYDNKSVIIILCGIKANMTSIYWKPKEINHFKKLKQIHLMPNIESLYEFITEFLIKSLKNDELGMISNI